MPLSLSEIEDIRDECLADDLDIDFERISLWERCWTTPVQRMPSLTR